MAKRIIAKDGDESLRKRCKDVTVFDDKLWTIRAWASKVAVVVPSPATSLVLVATSLTS